MARSGWLLQLSLELCCSLDPGLNPGPSIGPRLALASSCERIRYAIPFLPTESLAEAADLTIHVLSVETRLPRGFRMNRNRWSGAHGTKLGNRVDRIVHWKVQLSR